MFNKGPRLLGATIINLAAILAIFSPAALFAQRGGGGGRGGGRDSVPLICVHDCATPREGMSAEDDLKSFRRFIAVQANAEQRAAFAKVAQYTQIASDQVKDFHASFAKVLASFPLADRTNSLEEAIDEARAGNQNFLTSLSSTQKSGLQDLTTRLAKADSELAKQVRALAQIVRIPTANSEQIANLAASLEEKLGSFQTEQLALGREMGILPPTDRQEFAFSLSGASETAYIPLSGTITRTAAENGNNVFTLKLTADISNLQENLTDLIRPRLNRSPRCGERIEIQRATLTPLVPASLVVTDLHYERWICPPGQASPMEVVETDATVEVTITPSVEPNSGLHLVSEITHVDATGLLRDSLLSGELGMTLREQIATAMLGALQSATDLKAQLPPVARESAALRKVQFQDAGANQLTLVLEGQIQLSDDQMQQFATQLKLPQSAQEKPSQ